MKQLFKLSLLLLTLLLPATATAYDIEVDGIYYDIHDNVATVTYKNHYVRYAIYDYVNHEVIGEFDNYSSDYSDNVTIPSSISFGGKSYSVTSIGDYAFINCSALTSVTIPNSVTTIGNSAFTGCNALTSITIPNLVTSIGCDAFGNCTGLASVTIPNSDTYIGDNAFDGTAWFDNQPDGLVYAGLVAYRYKGTMPEGTGITLFDGTLGIAGSAFVDCTGLTSVAIPNSVTFIGNWAFNGCSALTSIDIPNTVTSIGNDAFSDCTGLASVTIPNSVTYIGDNAFDGTAWFDNQPDGLVYAGLVAYRYKGTMPEGTGITLSDGTLGIAGSAFFNCTGLTSVTIPNSITTIGDWAFAGCSGLTSIDIPNSVTSIGDWVFNGCSGLTSIDIPNSVTSIGYRAFNGCRGLTCIVIPQFVTRIGRLAFFNCTGLTSVTIPNSVTYIGDWAFLHCTSLMDIYSYIQNPAYTTLGIQIFEYELRNSSVRTLHVPIGTVEAYQAEDGWSGFTIVEMAPGETNYFSMADTTVWHGDVIAIPVRLDNNLDVMAFQTDVFLPEGFSIVTDEDNEYLITPSDRLTSDHIIMADNANNGSVRVICYTPNEQPINGHEGDLFYIIVKAPDDAENGCSIGLRNSLLTTTDYQELVVPDTTATITVIQFIPGDVNDSRTVNVTDIVVAAQYILDRNPNPFIFEAADMNSDGNVTVTDIMLIAYLINHPTMNAPRRMPALMDCSDRMSGEGVTLAEGETRTVSIALDNEMLYTAFQFDLTLPEGLKASNFQLTNRAGSHAFDVNTLTDGKTRALCYSPAIEVIDGHEGALLTFDVTATAAIEGDITVDGIELVTADCKNLLLKGFVIGVNSTTSVKEIAVNKTIACVDYYNLAGQRIDRPESGMTLVVTTYTDGTRTTTKVIR